MERNVKITLVILILFLSLSFSLIIILNRNSNSGEEGENEEEGKIRINKVNSKVILINETRADVVLEVQNMEDLLLCLIGFIQTMIQL